MNTFRMPDVNNAIQWAEGMMLAPQHFQQDQIYHEQRLHHQMAQCQPYYWGIYKLDIDETKIARGKVIVNSVHAVMPDGLIVQYDASSDEPYQPTLEFDLSQIDQEKTTISNITVQLVIPIRTQGAASKNASVQRFESLEETQICDENTGENRVSVFRLQPKLELKVEDRIADKYISLPLLKIGLNGSTFEVTEYRPPQLAINFCPFPGHNSSVGTSLGDQIQSRLVKIRKKAMQIALTCRADSGGTESTTGQDRRNTISHLMSALPDMEILLESQKAHPFDLYRGLSRIVANIAPLSEQLVANPLPPYCHNDYIAGFHQGLSFIDEVLDDVKAVYDVAEFTATTEQSFTLPIKPEWEKKWQREQQTLLIELKPQPGVTEKQLDDWISACSIAAKDKQQDLRKARIYGCKFNIVERFNNINISSSNGSKLLEVEYDKNLINTNTALEILCTDKNMENYSPASITLYLPINRNQPQKTPARGSNNAQP